MFGPLVCALLLLPACGGSGVSSTTPTTSSPTTTPSPTATASGPPPTWRALPRAPIDGRIGPGVVWTGKEVIVWGGVIRQRSVPVAATGDGAAYDPSTDSWTDIAQAPAGVEGGGGDAAPWTGSAAVFWAGNSPDGPAAGGVYDPRTDTWRALPDGPLGPREGYVSGWTGKDLLIIGGTSGDGPARPVAAAVDPKSGSWRLLPGLNELGGFRPNGAVWDGTEVFLAGLVLGCPKQVSVCTTWKPAMFGYDPATDATTHVDLNEAPVTRTQLPQLAPIGWTGSSVALTAGDPSAGLVFYDPSSDSWSTGRKAPCSIPDSTYTQSAWLGDRFAIPCGVNRLQIYDVSSDTWQVIAAGPSPLNTRFGGAIAWTGKDLFAWSGTVYRVGNPTPNSGTIISLP